MVGSGVVGAARFSVQTPEVPKPFKISLFEPLD